MLFLLFLHVLCALEKSQICIFSILLFGLPSKYRARSCTEWRKSREFNKITSSEKLCKFSLSVCFCLARVEGNKGEAKFNEGWRERKNKKVMKFIWIERVAVERNSAESWKFSWRRERNIRRSASKAIAINFGHYFNEFLMSGRDGEENNWWKF